MKNGLSTNFFILVLISACLFACAKREDIAKQIKASSYTYARTITNTDLAFVKCFDFENDVIQSLAPIIKECAYYHYDELLKKSNSEYYMAVYYCIMSKHIEQNFENFKMEKVCSDYDCRNFISRYVISNERNDSNFMIFDTFFSGVICSYEKNTLEDFYCFKKDKTKLEKDIVDSFWQATTALRREYFQRTPQKKSEYERFTKKFMRAIEESMKIYLGKNKEYFSVKGLEEEKKQKCLEKVKPLIELYFPNFTIP